MRKQHFTKRNAETVDTHEDTSKSSNKETEQEDCSYIFQYDCTKLDNLAYQPNQRHRMDTEIAAGKEQDDICRVTKAEACQHTLAKLNIIRFAGKRNISEPENTKDALASKKARLSPRFSPTVPQGVTHKEFAGIPSERGAAAGRLADAGGRAGAMAGRGRHGRHGTAGQGRPGRQGSPASCAVQQVVNLGQQQCKTVVFLVSSISSVASHVLCSSRSRLCVW